MVFSSFGGILLWVILQDIFCVFLKVFFSMTQVKVELIGPYPPCVRCFKVFQTLREIKKEIPEMILERVEMTSEKAKSYGKIVKVEDFAKEFGINMNLDLRELFRQRDLTLIEEKIREYIKKAEGFIGKAEERDVLLTPIIVINGEIKSVGKVPEKEELRDLIKSLNDK